MTDQTESIDHGCIDGARHHCANCEARWSEDEHPTPEECNVCGYPIADVRALEAKVRDYEQTAQQMAARWTATIADRDRLAGEGERLKTELGSLGWEVERLQGGVEFWRGSHAIAENGLRALEAELAAARENEARYLWLRDAEWPMDVWAAVTHRSNAIWDQTIDAARRAGKDITT